MDTPQVGDVVSYKMFGRVWTRAVDRVENDSRTGEPKVLFRNESGSWTLCEL